MKVYREIEEARVRRSAVATSYDDDEDYADDDDRVIRGEVERDEPVPAPVRAVRQPKPTAEPLTERDLAAMARSRSGRGLRGGL